MENLREKWSVKQIQQSVKLPSTSFVEQTLTHLYAQSPVIKCILENYGQATLADYLRQNLLVCKEPLQPRDDLFEVVYHYADPLLGKEVAEKVVQELKILPAVLTVNHHGVDFLAQSVQGSLVFSLRKIGNKTAETVPVFACGNVALNNSTYPRGLLIYHTDPKSVKLTIPIRLPIFPDRYKRKIVSVVEAFDSKMLANFEHRFGLMFRDKKIPEDLAFAVKKIINEDYRNPNVMKLKNYSQQAVVLNNRIWKRFYREAMHATEMVCLELEQIVILLLQADLHNEDSLMWQIMFNPTLRSQVLSQLDGAKACWDRAKLAKRARLSSDIIDNTGGSGTIFFWGVDNDGYRIPLLLVGSGRQTMLQGRDDRGKLWSFAFNKQDVIGGLKTGRLLPSLFTCYSTIGFARGVSCCGGYFQAQYLPAIKNGLVRALYQSADCADFAQYVDRVPSDIYLSGMQLLMRCLDENLLLPAGPIEIVSGGGLCNSQIERMKSFIVRDAHLAGLLETLADFDGIIDRQNTSCFLLALAREIHKLRDQAIVI